MRNADDLMFLDLEGNRVNEPDGIVLDGLEDARYRQRIPAFVEILGDRTTHPWQRFLACYVLVAWGNEQGYREVIRVASNPASAPRIGMSRDDFYSTDDTFQQLLEAIPTGCRICVDNGTQSLRIEALRALIRLLPDWYVERTLSMAVQPVIAEVRDDVIAAIEIALRRLRNHDLPDFDLGRQVADTVLVLLGADEESMCALATALLKVDDSWEVKDKLFTIVVHGRTPASRRFARTLAWRGGPRTWASLTEALIERASLRRSR